MKKFITIALAATGTFLLSGMELPLYPAAKKNTPVIQAAFENNGNFYRLAFKLAPGTGNDFSINSVYVFTDNDRNTGRKGIGNEYFLDVKMEHLYYCCVLKYILHQIFHEYVKSFYLESYIIALKLKYN